MTNNLITFTTSSDGERITLMDETRDRIMTMTLSQFNNISSKITEECSCRKEIMDYIDELIEIEELPEDAADNEEFMDVILSDYIDARASKNTSQNNCGNDADILSTIFDKYDYDDFE